MNRIEVRHLRYFIAVAEELNFSRAATRLNIAQPPLSQQIRDLENALGASLLTRTSRRVALTPAGTTFLESARRVLVELTHAIDSTQRAARGDVATLKVGFTDSAALSVLPRAVRAFQARFPNVHLDLTEASTHAQANAVHDAKLDVALVRGPVSDARLRSEVVFQEPFAIAVADDHVLATQRRASLSRLADEPIILFPRRLAPEFFDTIIDACHSAGFSPRVVLEAAEFKTILSLVATGLGSSIVPLSVSNLRRVGVTIVPITDTTARAEIVAVYREDRLSDALAAFIASAREVGTASRRSANGQRAKRQRVR